MSRPRKGFCLRFLIRVRVCMFSFCLVQANPAASRASGRPECECVFVCIFDYSNKRLGVLQGRTEREAMPVLFCARAPWPKMFLFPPRGLRAEPPRATVRQP